MNKAWILLILIPVADLAQARSAVAPPLVTEGWEMVSSNQFRAAFTKDGRDWAMVTTTNPWALRWVFAEPPVPPSIPFAQRAVTNFQAHTNGKANPMFSTRDFAAGWTTNGPTLVWATNSLIYGWKGATAYSHANNFAGLPGQMPVTLLTRRHGYMRGHGSATANHTNSGYIWPFGAGKVWFLDTNNVLQAANIVAGTGRYGSTNYASTGSRFYDYSIVLFDADVTNTVETTAVGTYSDLTNYWTLVDVPNKTEVLPSQYGNVCTIAGASAYIGFYCNAFIGGDSGGPNWIPGLPKTLVMVGGRTTSPFHPIFFHDLDRLTLYADLNTNNYQVEIYDFSE